MSRLSQIFHEAEKSKVLEGVVGWLDGVTTLSGDQKKALALDVMTVLHVPVYGPLADTEVAAIGGAIEFVLARVRAWADEALAYKPAPPAPAPVPATDPSSVSYDTEDEAIAHLDAARGFTVVVQNQITSKFVVANPAFQPLPGVQVYPKP